MKLKEWRWLKGIKQQSLAKKLGYSQATISLAESGREDCIKLVSRKFLEIFGKKEYERIDEFKET